MTTGRGIHPKAPGVSVGVTDAMIHDLVHGFYARVRADDLLGPIFNAAIDDWDHHLDKLCAFWSSVTLMTGRYKGSPMQVHAEIPGIASGHFDRWLALFRHTAQELCPPEAAALFIDRAERIAQSLELGIAVHRGQFVGGGGRLVTPAASPRDPRSVTEDV